MYSAAKILQTQKLSYHSFVVSNVARISHLMKHYFATSKPMLNNTRLNPV